MTAATGKRIVCFKFVNVVGQRIVRIGRRTDSRSLFRHRHRFLRDMHHFGYLFIKSIRIIAGKATAVGILAGDIHRYTGKVFLDHRPHLFECLQMMFLIAVHQHEEFVFRMGRTDMPGFHITELHSLAENLLRWQQHIIKIDTDATGVTNHMFEFTASSLAFRPREVRIHSHIRL